MSVKIFVGNLNENAESHELRRMFERFGMVTECDVLHRYGFVHMDSESDAKVAIENLNGAKLCGQPMNVEISKSKPKREGSNYGKATSASAKRGRDGMGPMRGSRGGRGGPYDRDYPPSDYYRRGGYPDFPPMEDRDPRGGYWPPPEVYFRWFYETYYPSRDPMHRPPPEYYRRERGDRDYAGFDDKDRDRGGYPPFPRPGERDFGMTGNGRADYTSRGGSYGGGNKGDYGGMKSAVASMQARAGYGQMDGSKPYAYTTNSPSSYTGANYTSFGK